MWWSSWSTLVFAVAVVVTLERIYRSLERIRVAVEMATSRDVEEERPLWTPKPKAAEPPDPSCVDDGGKGVEALLRSRGLR